MRRGGFTDERWLSIARILLSIAPCDRVAVFGSRAKGTWREGSDVDLAVWGSAWEPLTAEKAREQLEESCFPWTFDVVLPERLQDPDLLGHIQRVGFELPLPHTFHPPLPPHPSRSH